MPTAKVMMMICDYYRYRERDRELGQANNARAKCNGFAT